MPVYETSSAEQVEWILADSGAVAVFAENTVNAATVEAARKGATSSGIGGAPAVRQIWVIEPEGGRGAVEDLMSDGAGTADSDLDARRRFATPDVGGLDHLHLRAPPAAPRAAC